MATHEEIEFAAKSAIRDEHYFNMLIDQLKGASRRKRQTAAAVLACIARESPDTLSGHSNELVDALNRPEAQTRWECLDALSALVDVESRSCDKAIPGAETALFDENNGLVRLAAMRFLCHLGATTEMRSEKVWPLIDEAIQCYHGDPEFQDMLIAVTGFSEGKLAESVKDQLKDRMSFDAVSGKGALKKRAALIVENLS